MSVPKQHGFYSTDKIVRCPVCGKKQTGDLGSKISGGEILENCPNKDASFTAIVSCDKCDDVFYVTGRVYYTISKHPGEKR